MLGDFLIESITRTCRDILSCRVPPAVLSNTPVVKCVEVSMLSSFLQGPLHMVRPYLGKALEKVEEKSKVKAIHGVLMASLLHFKTE